MSSKSISVAMNILKEVLEQNPEMAQVPAFSTTFPIFPCHTPKPIEGLEYRRKNGGKKKTKNKNKSKRKKK